MRTLPPSFQPSSCSPLTIEAKCACTSESALAFGERMAIRRGRSAFCASAGPPARRAPIESSSLRRRISITPPTRHEYASSLRLLAVAAAARHLGDEAVAGGDDVGFPSGQDFSPGDRD